MKKFLYLQTQGGQGCDYTIGCGYKWDYIEANSKEEAIEKAMNLPDNWQSILDEDNESDMLLDSDLNRISDDRYTTPLESVSLIEIKEEIDLMPIFKAKLEEIESYKKSITSLLQEKAEKRQYEKLKKKFENK